ncbi:MAG: hypothetical protein HGA85_06710 [Nanoarchaeota archaeon]|nr:hypothetical protein [Nanoarchaeota archaeon]
MLDWKSWPNGAGWGQKTLDPVRFPDPDGLIAQVHALGARFMISIWPLMTGDCPDQRELRERGLLLGNQSTYNWLSTKEVTLFGVESMQPIDFLSLQSLGRDINNATQDDDFYEADANLSLSMFADSINRTFFPGPRRDLIIYGRTVKSIPMYNSTNSSNFETGILWDTSDGGTEYDGSQDIIFLTVKNQTKAGKFGSYDYEMRVPASLKSRNGGGSISFYLEIT